MRTILIVAGAVWFSLAMLMVLAIACAARRHMPQPPRRSRPSTSMEASLIVEGGTEIVSKDAEMETLVQR